MKKRRRAGVHNSNLMLILMFSHIQRSKKQAQQTKLGALGGQIKRFRVLYVVHPRRRVLRERMLSKD